MTTPAIILGLLMTPLLIVGVINWLAHSVIASPTLAGRLGITLVFLFTGIGHFIKTEPMAEMLPPWVPVRIPLVYAAGFMEFAAAIGVLIPRSRLLVGWFVIVMLLTFLPVNVYAAANHIGMGGHQWGPIYLLIRVPLQAILIAWVWRFAVHPATGEPVVFSCQARLPLSPKEIGDQILNVANWTDFKGYGPLPGIEVAEFEVRTPEVVGSRIRVKNTDGSSHVEEIVEWQPNKIIRLYMSEFSPPLSRLATGFDETWEFEFQDAGMLVTRRFELHAKSPLARPILWMISLMLKRAIQHHLNQLK
jgi:uncharacterized membrane protein